MTTSNTKTKTIVNAGEVTKIPRYNVISLRVSDEQRRYLDSLVVGKNKSVSDVMREALSFYSLHGIPI